MCNLILLLLAAPLFAAEVPKTEPPLTDVRLKEIIQTHNLRSSTAVLAKLHELYQVPNFKNTAGDFEAAKKLDILNEVVPVEATGSELQNADEKHPRLLFVNTEGTFFMAMDGDPKSSGNSIIQLIQLKERQDERGKRRRYWDFQQIDLPTDEQGTVKIHDGGPHHSAKPTSCYGCHRGHPLVEPYAFWPGWFSAYESATAREKKLLKDFVEAQKDHSFYKYVADRLQNILPYGASANIEDFNRKASQSNFLVIEDELKASPSYGPFRFALLAAVLGCPKIEAYIPDALKLGKTSLQKLYVETRTINKAHFDANVAASKEGAGPLAEKANQDGSSLFQTVGMRWVVEEMMGIKMGDWSMTFMKPSYAFADGDLGLFRLAAPINQDVGLPSAEVTDAVKAVIDHLEALSRKGQTSVELSQISELDLPANQAICALLKTKSKDALEKALRDKALVPHAASPSGTH